MPDARSASLRVLRSLVAVAAAAGALGAQVVRTADPARRGYTEADFPRVQRLADGVYTYEALRSAGAERFTTVSLFVVTPMGVLVADGQENVAETRRLVEAIAKVTPQPITHVVVASDHGDHTGGNAAFPRAATFYAHPLSRSILESAAAGDTTPGAVKRSYVPVDERTVLRLGGREIQLMFLGRAHTGGDLSVYLPRERILFMSEAYLNRVFPAMRSAFPTEWVSVIERAQRMPVDVYVPGHGFVETPAVLREELETFRQAVRTVTAEAARLHDAGVPVEEAVARARFGDLETWSLRSSQGPIAVRRVYLERDGKLPPPCGPSTRPRSAIAVGLGSDTDVPVRGRVIGVGDGTLGKPVVDARIVLEPGRLTATTDSAGAFRFTTLPQGRYEILVRAVGFAVARDTVTFGGWGLDLVAGLASDPLVLRQCVRPTGR